MQKYPNEVVSRQGLRELFESTVVAFLPLFKRCRLYLCFVKVLSIVRWTPKIQRKREVLVTKYKNTSR